MKKKLITVAAIALCCGCTSTSESLIDARFIQGVVSDVCDQHDALLDGKRPESEEVEKVWRNSSKILREVVEEAANR